MWTLCPDIEPAADSNTSSGIPDASSQSKITLPWLWTPANASGCSFLEVLADINASALLDFKTILSLFTSTKSCNGCGISPIHFFSSANKASNNWPLVGAVTISLQSRCVSKVCINIQLATEDLPTPWAERTDTFLSPETIASISSDCHLSGEIPKTFSQKRVGSFL